MSHLIYQYKGFEKKMCSVKGHTALQTYEGLRVQETYLF